MRYIHQHADLHLILLNRFKTLPFELPFVTSPIPILRVESGIKSLAFFRQIKAINYLTIIYVNPSLPLHEVVTEEDSEMNILVPTSNKRFLERTKVMKDEYNIDFSVIMKEFLMHTPPWHIFNYTHVCEQLNTERKSELNPTDFRSIFEDHFRLHINDAFVFTD